MGTQERDLSGIMNANIIIQKQEQDLSATTNANIIEKREQDLSAAMNAKIIGSGSQAMVLAHGYGTDQSIWDKIMPVLAQNYKVIVFDWPFSGAVLKDPKLYDTAKYSSYDGFADHLIAFLDKNDLKSTVFVGHSMSGMIGCIASVKRPELFKRLIPIGASPRYINTDDYEGGFKVSDIDQIITNIETNYFNWCSSFASLIVDTKDPASTEKFEKLLKTMNPEVALPLAKTVFYSDHRETLEKVTTPCTIVQASNDVVIPNSVAYYMQEKIKGTTTVEIIECGGHFPQLTAHLQVLDVIKKVVGV